MNGIELVGQKKFLTNISHTWNITCKPKKFLTNGVTCKPKKVLTKIYHAWNTTKKISHEWNRTCKPKKIFSQIFLTHGTQPIS